MLRLKHHLENKRKSMLMLGDKFQSWCHRIQLFQKMVARMAERRIENTPPTYVGGTKKEKH